MEGWGKYLSEFLQFTLEVAWWGEHSEGLEANQKKNYSCKKNEGI